MNYLHKRGLNDNTLRTWGIGFCPMGAWKGIVIPCQDGAGLHYVKIRRSGGVSPKYINLKGSHVWLYGLQTFTDVSTAFIFESELCALLAWQTGFGVGVASIPAGQEIHADYLPFFKEIEDVLVAFDNDDPGWQGAEKLCRLPGFHQAPPFPAGKDLTEYYQLAGNPDAVVNYLYDAVGVLNVANGR